VGRELSNGVPDLDLKVYAKEEGLKIIEFKTWWNASDSHRIMEKIAKTA
jgi:hypothetical protein